jgi:hypothetical protein
MLRTWGRGPLDLAAFVVGLGPKALPWAIGFGPLGAVNWPLAAPTGPNPKAQGKRSAALGTKATDDTNQGPTGRNLVQAKERTKIGWMPNHRRRRTSR